MIERETGYYWVIFKPTVGPYRWQPGGWDKRAQMWMLLGSDTLWYDFQIEHIGPLIEGAPALPPHRRPDPQP